MALAAVSGLCAAQNRCITLQDCLESAQGSDPYVKNAALDVESATAMKKEAFVNYLPKLSLSGYGYKAIDPLINIGLEDLLGSSEAAFNAKYYLETVAGLGGIDTQWAFLGSGFGAVVSAAQPLYAGGRIVNGNALAALGVEAARLKGKLAERESADKIEEKYWLAESLAEKKKALAQAVSFLESVRKDVLAAKDAGLASEADLMQVLVKKKEIDQQMQKLLRGEKLAKMDLFNAAGIEYRFLELDSISLTSGFDSLQDPQAYYMDAEAKAAESGEARLLELNVRSKELEKKMALGESLPQVGVGASYGYGKIIGAPRANGAVYATVSIPLTDWLKTSQKMKRCSNELRKSQNEKEYLDAQLVLKANKEWMDLQSAWEDISVKEDDVELASLLLSQKRSAYGAGMCTLTELLECQTSLQKSEAELVDARIAYCNALAKWND